MNQRNHDDQPYLVVDSPYELARWRPLVNWVLYVPHLVVLYALQILSSVASLIYWIMLIVTGRLHSGLYGVMVMYERYNARASGFLLGYTETYPPFEFGTSPADDGGYQPVRLSLPATPAAVSRSAALNVFKAIPHYVVLVVFSIGAAAVGVTGWFIVLFTGRWPAAMRDFLVRVSNYYYRVWTYAVMVDNTYPTFGLPTR